MVQAARAAQAAPVEQAKMKHTLMALFYLVVAIICAFGIIPSIGRRMYKVLPKLGWRLLLPAVFGTVSMFYFVLPDEVARLVIWYFGLTVLVGVTLIRLWKGNGNGVGPRPTPPPPRN